MITPQSTQADDETGAGVPGEPTGRLTVTTDPPSLAITISDHALSTVATGVSPYKARLPRGLYVVRAVRAGAPDLVEFAWIVPDSNRSVHLSVNEASNTRAVMSLLSGLVDRYYRKLDPVPSSLPIAIPTSDGVSPGPFWIRFFRLKDWDSAEQIELPKFSVQAASGTAVLDIRNPLPRLVFAQIGKEGERALNVAIPPAGSLRPARCELVVSSGIEFLEARVRLSTEWANSALQYMARGYVEEATQLVDSAPDDRPNALTRAARRVFQRFDDPAAALIPRYLNLRTRHDTPLSTLGEAMLDAFQEDPSDGRIITAEIAARERRYRAAATAILGIPPGRMPLFTEGLSLLIHRLRDATDPDLQTPPDQTPTPEEIGKLRTLHRTLSKWAPFLLLNSPTVTFRGNELTAPSASEAPAQPVAADGWLLCTPD